MNDWNQQKMFLVLPATCAPQKTNPNPIVLTARLQCARFVRDHIDDKYSHRNMKSNVSICNRFIAKLIQMKKYRYFVIIVIP